MWALLPFSSNLTYSDGHLQRIQPNLSELRLPNSQVVSRLHIIFFHEVINTVDLSAASKPNLDILGVVIGGPAAGP